MNPADREELMNFLKFLEHMPVAPKNVCRRVKEIKAEAKRLRAKHTENRDER